MKYSDLIASWLSEEAYTHCFFVAGGNTMHLLESVSRRLTCVPTVHEVAAGIAAEYFNATSPKGCRAFALVTAGPGLTNIVTAMAGAFLESRELLVIGGQVKTADLSRGAVRQRGIQEIDGIAIAESVTVLSHLMEAPLGEVDFKRLCARGAAGRPGPVFIEFPLDIQAREVAEDFCSTQFPVAWPARGVPSAADLECVASALGRAARPVLLLGGGVSRKAAAALAAFALRHELPLQTTWNGADRLPAEHPCYFGRPNTWGQRYANLVLQQADVIIALGTRLGLQQTGFNWQAFGPGADIFQVDCDAAELGKGHPRVTRGVCADADQFVASLLPAVVRTWPEWRAYCEAVKRSLPLVEPNTTGEGYVSPYRFVESLSRLAGESDIVIPCSSGGAFTVMMQVFAQKAAQRIVTDKGLAAMGYGLSGAIGAALANPDRRTLLVEGDGGFAQNLQEIGTAAVNRLNLKMFIFEDSGYASIRMTQRNYFGGRYVGCDLDTGLGLPNWERLFPAYNVPVVRLRPGWESDAAFQEHFGSPGPAAFLVTIDPNQTYFPKITSRVTPTGMESNPLHLMTPDLDAQTLGSVARFLP